MPHDVFISHSTDDKLVALALCDKLESAGVRCWIAPRDVEPGAEWGKAIVDAISGCRVLVLVFSSKANESRHIRREVQTAFEKDLTVIPFRVEDTQPTGTMEYYLASVQWLDALPPPAENHLMVVVDRVKTLLPGGAPEAVLRSIPHEPQTAAQITPQEFIRSSEAIPAHPAELGSRSKPSDRVIESLAVLPLVNETDDSTMEYLSDGISEGIINILSQLSSMRVMARSTVFRYKGRNMDARRAGRALKVDGVLSGALFRRANQFMIKVELLSVADGTQIWGQRFTVGDAEVFNAEEIISREIAEKLQIRLTEAQRNRVEKQNTSNPAAYRLYLQGRYQWSRRTEEGLRKAIEYFQQAIENDCGYARAWAGLADSYAMLGCYGYDAPHQCYPKAKAAAERALELDDSVAEAHTSLAVAKKDYYWDWAGAEEGYLRALKLNPNSGATRQWYGEYLACVGRHAESIAELQQARQLDPLSPIVAATAGRHGYFFARQFDRAFTELQEIVRTDPQFWIGHNFLGWVHVVKGQWPEALAEFGAAQRLDDNPETLVGIGYASALSGQQLAARQIVENLKALRAERYVQPISIALVHAALGEEDEGFVWLEHAFEEHAQWLTEIKVDPAFDPFRSDSRFNELLKRIGLA